MSEKEISDLVKQRDKYRQDYKRIKVRYNHIVSLTEDTKLAASSAQKTWFAFSSARSG